MLTKHVALLPAGVQDVPAACDAVWLPAGGTQEDDCGLWGELRGGEDEEVEDTLGGDLLEVASAGMQEEEEEGDLWDEVNDDDEVSRAINTLTP